MAEHLAGLGYVVLLLEMYYRHGPYEPFDLATAFSDGPERDRMFGMITGLTKVMAAGDAGAFLEFLADRPEVASTTVGTTGYCMGGGLSLTAATTRTGSWPPRRSMAATRRLTPPAVRTSSSGGSPVGSW